MERHTIGWAGPHNILHDRRYDVDWWRQAVARHGGVLHNNRLACTCGWLSFIWTVEWPEQWQPEAERHGRTHGQWQWDDDIQTVPTPQTIPGM